MATLIVKWDNGEKREVSGLNWVTMMLQQEVIKMMCAQEGLAEPVFEVVEDAAEAGPVALMVVEE